jgi:hypothetical protein
MLRWRPQGGRSYARHRRRNLGDRHLTSAVELSTLVAGLALAVALSNKAGIAGAPLQPIGVADNRCRRKSSSSKRSPQPPLVPKTLAQPIEIFGILKKSLV